MRVVTLQVAILSKENILAIPPLQKQLAEMQMKKYCENKIPKEIQDKLKLKFSFRGNSITLFESRPSYRDPEVWLDLKVAQMRLDNKTMKYSLYCCDRNDKWIHYDFIEPTKELEDLLDEIENDSTGIFWG